MVRCNRHSETVEVEKFNITIAKISLTIKEFTQWLKTPH
jgi:hypothetical protein